MQKNLHKKILNITFISLFAAISYIALTVFFFPVGPMYVHFGNLIVVLAALLIGGWQGGMAGSIGMGLYDIFNGHADSSPKTFVLKFLIGLTVGLIFTFIKNRKKYPTIPLIISGAVSILIAIGLILAKENYSESLSILCPIFIVIGVSFFIFASLKAKFSQKTAAAIVGAACGMTVNIIGEITWKTVQFWISGASFNAAFIGAIFAQSSTLINAGIAIVGGVALFLSLEKPFSKILNK